jgi:Domain of unknown function (DUF4258)
MVDRKYKSALQGILLLAILAFAIWKIADQSSGEPSLDCDWRDRKPVQELVYVDHARCRMGCRDIDQSLVEDVYLNGEVNCAKSSVKDGNRRYALEKRDARGDKIRVIVEDDDGRHVIITVIRLDRDDKCSCS